MMNAPAIDIVLSHDFLPKVGGAHSWLYEVYRRWPDPVMLLTLCPGRGGSDAAAERAFDAGSHGSLSILRRLRPVASLDVLAPGFWLALVQHLRQVRRLARRRASRLHALRAFPEGIDGWLAKRLAPGAVQLVTYAHGEEILIAGTSRQLRWIAERVYRDSDLVIANSENTRRMVLALCPQARVVVVHPGVDAAAYVQSADQVAATRAQWGWGAGALVLATVARMEARKNQAMVIRAVAELTAAGADVRYICAGDGPEKAALMALAEGLGVRGRVLFPGAVSDATKKLIFASADVHIMPSIQVGEMIEGFGIVFLEAAAAGIPSICGNSGGQLEAVQDGVTGLSVDGRELVEVVNAISRLAQDPALRQAMGTNGRRFAAELDWQRVVTRTLAATRGQLRVAPDEV